MRIRDAQLDFVLIISKMFHDIPTMDLEDLVPTRLATDRRTKRTQSIYLPQFEATFNLYSLLRGDIIKIIYKINIEFKFIFMIETYTGIR